MIEREGYFLHTLAHALPAWNAPLNRGQVLRLGREGFFWIGKSLLSQGISQVLMPALICDVVPLAFEAAGIKPIYYAVNENYEPEWEELKKLLDQYQGQAAFLGVRYFGMNLTSDRTLRLAFDRGFTVIDDNAHGLLSKPTAPFHYRISSIGKVLGLKYGAYLETSKEQKPFVDSQLRRINLRSELSNALSFFPAKFFCALRTKNIMTDSQVLPIEIPTLTASPLAQLAWRLAPLLQIAHTRRAKYQAWQSVFNQLAPSLGESDVPWIYPLRASKGALPSGVESFKWPDLPKAITPAHPAWRQHYADIVALPVWKN